MQRRSRDKNVRTFEFMIRNEKKIREAVEEARMSKDGRAGTSPSGRARISDPTANEAIRHTDELRRVEIEGGGTVEWPERWIRVIDAVREWCEPHFLRREILRRRYAGESWVRTCSEIMVSKDRFLSESKYHRVVAQICSYGVKCAAQMQVVKIF